MVMIIQNTIRDHRLPPQASLELKKNLNLKKMSHSGMCIKVCSMKVVFVF